MNINSESTDFWCVFFFPTSFFPLLLSCVLSVLSSFLHTDVWRCTRVCAPAPLCVSTFFLCVCEYVRVSHMHTPIAIDSDVENMQSLLKAAISPYVLDFVYFNTRSFVKRMYLINTSLNVFSTVDAITIGFFVVVSGRCYVHVCVPLIVTIPLNGPTSDPSISCRFYFGLAGFDAISASEKTEKDAVCIVHTRRVPIAPLSKTFDIMMHSHNNVRTHTHAWWTAHIRKHPLCVLAIKSEKEAISNWIRQIGWNVCRNRNHFCSESAIFFFVQILTVIARSPFNFLLNTNISALICGLLPQIGHTVSSEWRWKVSIRRWSVSFVRQLRKFETHMNLLLTCRPYVNN